MQLYHLDLPGIQCQRIKTDLKLQQYIYYYWVLRVDAANFNLQIIPDNAIDLVLSPVLDGFSALYFPAIEKFTIALSGPVIYAGVSLKAENSVNSLGYDLSYLKTLDAGRETTNTLDLQSLSTHIHGCYDVSLIAKFFDEYFEQRLQKISPDKINKPKILNHKRWVDALQQSLGGGSLQTIANKLGLSERQFRRMSTQLFGLSPKKIQRVLRLQVAVRELFSADALTIQNQYYDDSHRIKELKKLTGMTPGSIRKMAEKYNQSK